jgi:threonine/homoserine/homoserine lactone efflux protein
MTNPKALFFFGAFIPQFIDPAKDAFFQTIVLGMVFTIVAAASDCIYAILAGKAGRLLTKPKVRVAQIVSGLCLITGGIWLALARRVS